MSSKYDFSGYVTRYDVECSDGRTIRKNAFSDCDGKIVPLVWNHQHDDVSNVLGNVLLETRPDGVYGYGSFNDSDKAYDAKLAVEHGDIDKLSIYANKLTQKVTGPKTKDVMHGKIKEVSLVFSGANIGAFIDTPVIQHSDESDTEYTEGTIYLSGLINPNGGEIDFAHAEDDSEKEDKKVADEKKDLGNKTMKELYEEAPEEYKIMCAFFVQQALQGAEAKHSDDDEDENEISEGGDEEMKHSAFEENNSRHEVICHADRLVNDINAILADDDKRDKIGSFKEFVNDIIQHDDDPQDPEYGVDNINLLYPDPKYISNTPDFIQRDQTWVGKWWNATRKLPFARIKALHADITEDAARAKGYIKGDQKWPEVFPLLTRSTEAQTIYKLQKIDHDDMIDITNINIIAFLKNEMVLMLDEEKARAGLLGDGKQVTDRTHIKHDRVIPVYHDDALYAPKIAITTKANADESDKALAFIRACIKSRKQYKGSGSPTLFLGTDILTDMLLLTDGVGRPLYDDVSKLATKLRVKEIVECELFDGQTRTDSGYDYALAGIIVNPVDYAYGSDRDFSYENFEDFDLDFNQHEILMETRISGMLTKPYSALVLEFKEASGSSNDNDDNEPSG